MRTRCFPLVLAVSLVVFALANAAIPTLADDVYHSQHIALVPVDGFPLRSGFVENIHANGPIIFAHENYVLNGATPNASFEIYLIVHPDPDCAIQIVQLNTASLTTNVTGNGKAQSVITPDMAPHEATLYMRWELRRDGNVAYQTACSMAVLD